MKPLYITCCVILGIAVFPLPIGFYTLVRIIVTIGAVVGAIKNSENGINGWSIILGVIAILFNPIIPVFLYEKGAWVVIDLLAMIVFIYQLVRKS